MEYEELVLAGIDVKSLTNRLMGNTSLIQRFMNRLVENEHYSALQKAIANGDYKAACSASHTLKGICANLSINELFELFAKQVTLFRADENQKACDLMSEISEKYDSTILHVSNWLSE